jgi:hypothetical protein
MGTSNTYEAQILPTLEIDLRTCLWGTLPTVNHTKSVRTPHPNEIMG